MPIITRAGLVAALAVLAVFAWSCSSDHLTNPFTVTEAGSVSLLVVASLEGAEDIGSGTFSTELRVTLRDTLGQWVNDALVAMVNQQAGTITLAWDSLTPGVYTASTSDYAPGTYLLHVKRDTDSLVNAQVHAPDIHTITYPTTADTLDRQQPFTVTWNRLAPAELVEIETRDFGPSLITGAYPDSGSYQIPSSNRARDDQRIRVWRSNSQELITGLPGSTFRAEIRNAVEPIVVQ